MKQQHAFFHRIHQRLYFWKISYIPPPFHILAMLIQQQIKAGITPKKETSVLEKNKNYTRRKPRRRDNVCFLNYKI